MGSPHKNSIIAFSTADVFIKKLSKQLNIDERRGEYFNKKAINLIVGQIRAKITNEFKYWAKRYSIWNSNNRSINGKKNSNKNIEHNNNHKI